MLIDSSYDGAGGGGGGGGGGDDLMAYNAYPSEHTSYSSAFGGSGGAGDTGFMDPDGRQQQQALALAQQQQQQQMRQPQQLQQQQQQSQQTQQQQQAAKQQLLQQQQQQQQLLLQQQQAQALALAQAQAQSNAASASPYLLSPGGQPVNQQQKQPIQASALAPLAPPGATSEDDPGYLETLWQRRRDVAKLCVLALTVLLAISAHSAAWHYLREYIETAARLTYWQEVGLRAAYPAVVLLVLWNLKALGTK